MTSVDDGQRQQHPRVRVLLVSSAPSIPMRVLSVENRLSMWQELVGGFLEPVLPLNLEDDDWAGYCDEEGRLKGRSVNSRATVLAHALGWPNPDQLAGDVVFFGSNGIEEADVPGHVVEVARGLGYVVEVVVS